MVQTNQLAAVWLPLRRKLDARPTVAIAAGLAAALWHVLLAIVLCWWRFEEVPLYETDLLNSLDWRWQNRTEVREKNLYLAGLTLLLIFIAAYVIWRAVRLRQPRAVTLPWFFVCWWQSCLLGTLVIPAGLLLAWWTSGAAEYGLLIVVPYVLFAPAAIAPRIIPTVQRWRPVCPECGHTVAYAVEPRCNECGEPYVCPDRFYRRWAIQRAPWDRRGRTLFFAYLQTLFMILFRPASAAWRLSCPDRFGRALRWMLGHALAPAVFFAGFIAFAMLFWGGPVTSVTTSRVVAADTAGTWALAGVAQGFAAWSVAAVVYPVAIGVCLSLVAPTSQPAARLGMIKWSLYAGAIMLGAGIVLFLGWAGIAVSSTFAWGSFAGGRTPGLSMNFFFSPVYPLIVLNAIYAIWWAIGVASQPNLEKRGSVAFLIALAAFGGFWGLVPRLFDLSGLEGLL